MFLNLRSCSLFKVWARKRTQAIQMLLTQNCLKVPPTTNFVKIWGCGNRGILSLYPRIVLPSAFCLENKRMVLMIIPTGLKNSFTTAAKPCTMIQPWFLNSSVIKRSEKPCSKVMLKIRKNHTIKLSLSQHNNLMFGLGGYFVCLLFDFWFLGVFYTAVFHFRKNIHFHPSRMKKSIIGLLLNAI